MKFLELGADEIEQMLEVFRRAWPKGKLFGIQPPKSIGVMSLQWKTFLIQTINYIRGDNPPFDAVWLENHKVILSLPSIFKQYNNFEELLTKVLYDVEIHGHSLNDFGWFLYSPKFKRSELLDLMASEWTAKDKLPLLRKELGDDMVDNLVIPRGALYTSRVWSVVEWYGQHSDALYAAHYGPWPASPMRSIFRFVGEFLGYIGANHASDEMPVTYGPVWWNFLKYMKSTYQIDLDAWKDPYKIPEIPAPRKSVIVRPPAYPTWSERHRLWFDIVHWADSGFPLSDGAKDRLKTLQESGLECGQEDIEYILGIKNEERPA